MISQPSNDVLDLTRDDGATELQAHVQYRLGGRLPHFEVRITDLGLVLLGRARTYLARQLAEDTVREATAFPILANEIEVS